MKHLLRRSVLAPTSTSAKPLFFLLAFCLIRISQMLKTFLFPFKILRGYHSNHRGRLFVRDGGCANFTSHK
jgi:hypothetical protein